MCKWFLHKKKLIEWVDHLTRERNSLRQENRELIQKLLRAQRLQNVNKPDGIPSHIKGMR